MDNILKYPQSTIVSRVVPKTMFYKFMEVNPRMKSRFVNDVVKLNHHRHLSFSRSCGFELRLCRLFRDYNRALELEYPRIPTGRKNPYAVSIGIINADIKKGYYGITNPYIQCEWISNPLELPMRSILLGSFTP